MKNKFTAILSLILVALCVIAIFNFGMFVGSKKTEYIYDSKVESLESKNTRLAGIIEHYWEEYVPCHKTETMEDGSVIRTKIKDTCKHFEY